MKSSSSSRRNNRGEASLAKWDALSWNREAQVEEEKNQNNNISKEARTSTFKVSLDFEFIISFHLDAFGHLGVSVALVLASFIVIVVVVAVAVLTNVFTSLLKSVHLVLGPGIQELHHVHNVVSTSLARVATGVGGAKGELDKVLGVQQTTLGLGLGGNLDQTAASTVLDGVVGDEGHIALFVKSTSLGQKTLSKLGSCFDIKVGNDGIRGTGLACNKGKKKGGGTQEHGDLIVGSNVNLEQMNAFEINKL